VLLGSRFIISIHVNLMRTSSTNLENVNWQGVEELVSDCNRELIFTYDFKKNGSVPDIRHTGRLSGS